MDSQTLLALLGRLHPAAVHLPIACILLALFAEGYTILRGQKHRLSSFTVPLLIVGGFSGAIAALFGYFNKTDQRFYGEAAHLLFQHQLLSLVALALMLVAALFAIRCVSEYSHRTLLWTTRGAILFALAVVTGGAHQGALLVHGSDYFTSVFERSDRVLASLHLPPEFSDDQLAKMPAAVLEPVDFADHIEPIFEKKCARCHLDGKKKGAFQMDTRELLLKGGESGAVVIPGESRGSYLVQLVAGLEPDKIMPEKGDLLSEHEIALVRGWIDQGMKWDSTAVSDAEPAQKQAASSSSIALRMVRPPTCKKCGEKSNAVDVFLAGYFEQLKVKPPRIVSDDRYIRRLYIDVLGRLPTVEEHNSAHSLLRAKSPQALVEALLEREDEYAGAWLGYWNDLLRNDYSGPGFVQKNKDRKRKEITGWLKRALEKNMPYDSMVRHLISPSKRSEGFIRGILWPGVVNPNERPEMQAAQNVGQIFLGVNLKCASCHDSFTSDWKLQDSYSLASVFSKKPLEVFECDKATGELAHARFLFSEVDYVESEETVRTRLEQLAKSLTTPENGRFARTFVNRMWARLFGRGFQEPLDEPAEDSWNEELHNWLAVEFVQGGYDMKQFLKLVLSSEAYRYKSVPMKENSLLPSEDRFVFTGPFFRPLPGEAVFDTFNAFFEIAGPLTPTDLSRHGAGLEEKPKVIRVNAGESVRFEVPEDGAGGLFLNLRIPIKRKRKMENFPESTLKVSGKGVSNGILEYYRDDDLDERFVESKTGDVAYAYGTGMIRLSTRTLGGQTIEFLQEGKAPLDIVVYSGVSIRSSLREHNDLLASFGRPKRVNVTSRRDSLFSSPRILELATNVKWDAMLRFIGEQLRRNPNRLEILAQFLGRKLTEGERNVFERRLEEAPSDLMWVIATSPEFVVIS
ncbi:MAG: DUF1549 domain-containing protein [Bdellovibrionales bacterium]|nr:DUF1549 domain-containing protein [Bdellovibrionales bacterium]